MEVNKIDMVHHLMDRYAKIIKMDLKENQKIFDDTLDTTISIGKYFEHIDDCIQNSDCRKWTYTASQTINNT